MFWLRTLRAGILLWASLQVASIAFAQGAASSGGSASASGGNYTVMGGTSSSKPSAQPLSKSAHLVDTGAPPSDEANRKALEERAGSNGGKFLLRSTPSGAQVFIDGAFVGRTPLLLIVPPGKYKIRMHGPRESFSERTAEIAAQETQEIALKLSERYPEHVVAR